MVNLKQHHFSWGRRVPLSWREIGKSNFRLGVAQKCCKKNTWFHYCQVDQNSKIHVIYMKNIFWSCLGVKASTVDPCWPHGTQARSKWGESVVGVVRAKNGIYIIYSQTHTYKYVCIYINYIYIYVFAMAKNRLGTSDDFGWPRTFWELSSYKSSSQCSQCARTRSADIACEAIAWASSLYTFNASWVLELVVLGTMMYNYHTIVSAYPCISPSSISFACATTSLLS